jgi:hypothetical protein
LAKDSPRTVEHPDVIVPIDEQPADIADNPVVRQRLRPCWIHHEAGRRARFWHVRGRAFDQALLNGGFAQRIGSARRAAPLRS